MATQSKDAQPGRLIGRLTMKDNISTIIVAAGLGKRMGNPDGKQFLEIAGIPMLARTIQIFQKCEEISEIIIVVNEDKMIETQEIIDEYCRGHLHGAPSLSNGAPPLIKIVIGGKERQDSVYFGLQSVSKSIEYVLVHDGARPLLSNKILNKAIKEVVQYKACIVAVPAKDTIKVVDKEGYITKTPDRSTLWAAQTPQIFEKSLLLEAFEKIKKDKIAVTDDAQILEYLGFKVKIVEGSYDNVKVTTPEDLDLAEKILEKRKNDE